MPPRIERVTAQHFRGATQPCTVDFDPDKPFVLLFGENGTGKTTLVDAIDAVCNGEPGSLADMSGTKIATHVPSLGHRSDEVTVSVTIGGQTWTATLRSGNRTTYFAVEPKTHRPFTAILRRSRILSLVTSAPSQRFEQLRSFLDVEGVEKSEESLRKALREANRVLEERAAQVASAEQAIESAFKEESGPDEAEMSPREWARKRGGVVPSDLEAQEKTLKAFLDLYGQVDIYLRKSNDLQRDVKAALDEAAAVQQQIDAQAPIDAGDGVALVDLLQKARNYLTKNESGACPVCRRPPDGDLQQEITQRLEALAAYTDLAKRLKTAQDKEQAARNAGRRLYEDLVPKARDLLHVAAALPEVVRQWATFGTEEYPHLHAYAGELTRENGRDARELLKVLVPIAERAEQQRERLARQLGQLSAIRRQYSTLVAAEKELRSLGHVAQRLSRMLEVVEQKRKNFTDDLLGSIGDECDALYRRIHPDERLGGLRLALDRARRASLLMEGRFEDAVVPPQAYFSESHLDTLGFCCFLAVTKHITGGNAIVVIDDAFTSVDESHIRRIAEVLLEESQRFHQIILTTHQRGWVEMIGRNGASSGHAQVIELASWSRQAGVRLLDRA